MDGSATRREEDLVNLVRAGHNQCRGDTEGARTYPQAAPGTGQLAAQDGKPATREEEPEDAIAGEVAALAKVVVQQPHELAAPAGGRA